MSFLLIWKKCLLWSLEGSGDGRLRFFLLRVEVELSGNCVKYCVFSVGKFFFYC